MKPVYHLICQRLYLHMVGVKHVYPAGYLVHHLFAGALLAILRRHTHLAVPRESA